MARGALRVVLTALGGGLLIASAFLDWLAFEDAPKGTEVPIQFLWSQAEREPPEFAISLGLDPHVASGRLLDPVAARCCFGA
jgi:hypothetical protein